MGDFHWRFRLLVLVPTSHIACPQHTTCFQYCSERSSNCLELEDKATICACDWTVPFIAVEDEDVEGAVSRNLFGGERSPSEAPRGRVWGGCAVPSLWVRHKFFSQFYMNICTYWCFFGVVCLTGGVRAKRYSHSSNFIGGIAPSPHTPGIDTYGCLPYLCTTDSNKSALN